MPRHLKRQDGQAVVEFVVILPVLLLVLMAIYQFGQVFVNYMDVTSAAREGARKAAVSRSAGACATVDGLAISAAKAAASDLNHVDPERRPSPAPARATRTRREAT